MTRPGRVQATREEPSAAGTDPRPQDKVGCRLRRITLDEDLTMLIAAGRDGRLLGIGLLDIDGEDPVVIHAMPLRNTFAGLL